MRRTLSIWMEKRCGELPRVLGLFAARGYNIESLTVAETADPSVSQMTLVTRGDDRAIEQIVKRIDKQVRVLKVLDLTACEHVERRLALVRVKAGLSPTLAEVLNLVCLNRLRLVAVSGDSLTFEATGDGEQVSEVFQLLSGLGIADIACTGAVAMPEQATAGDENQCAASKMSVDEVGRISEPLGRSEQ